MTIPFYIWHLVMLICFSLIVFSKAILVLHVWFKEVYQDHDNALYEQAMRNFSFLCPVSTLAEWESRISSVTDPCHTGSWLG